MPDQGGGGFMGFHVFTSGEATVKRLVLLCMMKSVGKQKTIKHTQKGFGKPESDFTATSLVG